MSKSYQKRRKASDDGTSDGGIPPALNSLDLSNPKTTPKVIAAALLSLLPPGATKHDASAKKLLRAFTVLTAELDARSNAKAQDNQAEGSRLPIAFRFLSQSANNDDDVGVDNDGIVAATTAVIQMPEECFMNIMTFLNGRELVMVSTVNKVWLTISRRPALWPKLDAFNGLSNKNKKMNQTFLLALLGRPQFTQLRFLALPYKVKLKTSTIASIAKACPLLETWDVGYCPKAGRGTDADLIDAAQNFANLTSIRTSTWDVTPSGIGSVAKVMGEQLLDLRIRFYFGAPMSDAMLITVSEFCSNLKHFAYKEFNSADERFIEKRLSSVGVIHLVRGCRRLEVLELEHTRRIERADFETILTMLAQDPRSFALSKIDVVGYPFIIRSNPFAIINT